MKEDLDSGQKDKETPPLVEELDPPDSKKGLFYGLLIALLLACCLIFIETKKIEKLSDSSLKSGLNSIFSIVANSSPSPRQKGSLLFYPDLSNTRIEVWKSNGDMQTVCLFEGGKFAMDAEKAEDGAVILELEPGIYSIILYKDNYSPIIKNNIEIAPDGVREIREKFIAKTSALIKSNIKADVKLFDKNRQINRFLCDKNGFRLTNLSPGVYKIVSSKKGYFPIKDKKFKLVAGSDIIISLDFKPLKSKAVNRAPERSIVQPSYIPPVKRPAYSTPVYKIPANRTPAYKNKDPRKNIE